MKYKSLLGILIIIFFMMTGCSNHTFSSQVKPQLQNETWMQQVETNPNNWTRTADRWYLTGNSNQLEQSLLTAPPSASVTHIQVKTGHFDNINVRGSFQVQIVGYGPEEGVQILGVNQEARQINVSSVNNTLSLSQVDPKAKLCKVIVRISTRNIHCLTNLGISSIYGRDVTSDNLDIKALGSGGVYLSGEMNVTKITQRGTGTITVIGAETPSLAIVVQGNGHVNVYGRVGVQSIVHEGNGCISIIGADTNSLCISASGSGRTSVQGYANVKKITTKDSAKVYLYWVNSKGIYITATDQSAIGLAGEADILNIDLNNKARFDGQYLRSKTLYIKTLGGSHANTMTSDKLFASAYDQSSVYFYGSPSTVSRYTGGRGVILPVWSDRPPLNMPMRGGKLCAKPRSVYK